MRTQSKSIASARCGLVRNCANDSCIFSMLNKGYQLNPTSASQHNKNQRMERQYGKGFVPTLRYQMRNEFIDVICDLFIDKDCS